MPSAIILPQPESVQLAPRRAASLRLHVKVAATRHALDRQLARGASPDTPALRLRARQLRSARVRAAVADGIDRLVARAAQEPTQAPSAAIPLQRVEIRAAAGRLGELAEALRSDGTVSARGVAQAAELLTDGTGPVFACHPPGTLARHAARVMLTLAGRG